MAEGQGSDNQIYDLIFALLERYDFDTVDSQASVLKVVPRTIRNWKNQVSKRLNRTTVNEIADCIYQLGNRFSVDQIGDPSLCQVVIEDGAGPADVEKQLRERWDAVYLGHKFLYYLPDGANAWLKLNSGRLGATLAKGFYRAFTQSLTEGDGPDDGALAVELGWRTRRGGAGRPCGLDLISLGPGDGSKEARALRILMEKSASKRELINWLTYTPVEVSIPLLRIASEKACAAVRDVLPAGRWPRFLVRPSCSDFEDGGLGFTRHLSSVQGDRRIVLFLGGTFGNLRNETDFVEQSLRRLLRPDDLLWLEVGVRHPTIEDDPLYGAAQAHQHDAYAVHKRGLVEGPHRRFLAGVGSSDQVKMNISAREGDYTCEVPKSYNFVHDVEIGAGGRRCSVLYSRRYDVQELRKWFYTHGYKVVAEYPVKGSGGATTTTHLLLKRMRPRKSRRSS